METRRASQSHPANIPPPPPLPPSKSYFSRLVNQVQTSAYGSRPSSAQTNYPDHQGGRPNPLVPKLPGVRTASSQDASHKTGLPIEALDINRDRTHAILAGKDILKTVRVQQQPAQIVEETNLRAAVASYADHAPARQRDGLGIHDVKWSHGQFNTHIATAAANGKVILYDLNRAGVELARLHEHTRQVHRLAFNPHQGHLLLSASHDTTVRLWDLRDMTKAVTTCRSRDQYAGINGGIYDVQWSPTDAVEFAFGTDNGTIQRWDFRHAKASKQKIIAHDQKTCTAIDWHPDGKHLLSAGVDRTVKVWDFSVPIRRQKPVFVLTTPYPVHNARWRPPSWSDQGAYQCTQLATAYDRDHSVIHVWDVRRPYLPFREIDRFSSAPSDMLWHSRDTLWTVGREGIFQQNDVHHAPKVLDRRNLQAIALSPSGEIGGVAQARLRHYRHSTGSAYTDDTYAAEPRDKRSSPEKGSLRSSADDSFDDSFLLSKRHHGRTASNRSAKSFGSTPPSETSSKVIFLTDSLAMQHDASKPNQLAFRGALPGMLNVNVFSYLAQKYKPIPLPDPPTLQSFEELQYVFEQNADYAQRAALYRLATTWRIVGASVANSTQRRAQLHRARRRRAKAKPTTLASSSDIQPKHPVVEGLRAPDTISQADPALHNASSVATGTPNITIESSSNLATPLARPVTGTPLGAKQRSGLPDLDSDEKIELPPAITGPHSVGGGASQSQSDGRPNFKGPQWYQTPDDLDERRAMVGSWRAPPRVPLSFDATEQGGLRIQVPPRLDRHNSDESFAMFSASTDSQRAFSLSGSVSSSHTHPQSLSTDSMGESSFGRPGLPVPNPVDQPAPLDQSVQISPTTIPGKGQEHTTPSPVGSLSGPVRQDAGETNSQEQAVHDIEALRRNNQLLRHDSSESEAFTSSGSGLSVSSYMEFGHDLEASGTIVPEGYDARSPPVKPSALAPASANAPPVYESAAEEPLLLADFLAMRVDADEGSSFAMADLLQNLLTFFTDSQADAQTASLLLLLLAPLLPQTRVDVERPDVNVAAKSAAYAETFAALGLSPAHSETILSTEFAQLVATGIDPYQAESILETYHSQLHSLSLYNAAATLRRLAYPVYPAVYEQALKSTQIGLLCLSCKSPINNPKDKMRCETCKRAQAPCPICWGRYPAFEAPNAKKAKGKYRLGVRDLHLKKGSAVLSDIAIDQDTHELSPSEPETFALSNAMLWTWCPICGHGGHSHCLSTWFYSTAMSEGACATEGCLCDCVQGKRRDDKMEQALRAKAEKDRARVVRKGDDWKVGESKAVSAVRGAFDESAAARDTAPNTSAARKEDGRRVRVVEPHAEQGLPPPAQQGLTLGKMPK